MKPHLIPEAWSVIVKGLNKALQVPTDEHPNTRWLSEPALRRLLVAVRDSAGAPQAFSGKVLLDSLVACGLARPLPVASVPPGKKAFTAYCLELGGNPSITPQELLVTTQPNFRKTALCYFTAIQYHDLTTQVAPHHHIAVLKDYPARSAAVPEPSDRIPSQGTLLFEFEGTRCYETMRDRTLVPGVQTVRTAEHSLARITTFEQTLLDTLHRPWACGGPAVVFEAWERGAPRIDEARLAQYMSTIPATALARRIGYLLEQLRHVVTNPELHQQLEEAKAHAGACDVQPVPLLPSVPAQSVSKAWGLLV